MVAETDQLSYVGTNYDAESTTAGANTCKYYIGALDKQSSTMSLHRAELISLRPCIPGLTHTDLAAEGASPSKADYRTNFEQLVTSFGSEKAKRVHAAHERNKVESSALEGALATAVTHVQTEVEKAGVSQPQQNSGLIPAHNPAAEVPQDVYNLHDVVSLEEIRILKKTGKVFTKATVDDIASWRADERYPEYVLQHLSSLPTREPHRSLRAALLLYASFLIEMHRMNPRLFEKRGPKFVGEEPPPGVKDQLLMKFAERKGAEEGHQSSYVLSSRMKDKILSHLFVLVLIIDDFVVDCATLQQDLKLTTSKVMDHFRALGCSVTKSAVKRKAGDDGIPLPSSCTANLKIPLSFPKLKKGPRKQRN